MVKKDIKTNIKIFGDIFEEKFNINPKDLTLEQIEKIAIKNINFKEYAIKLVKNIFYKNNKKITNIDKKLNIYFRSMKQC